VPLRATFIVDLQVMIRWASVNDLSVGRNVDEVLRVLDALQTGELCPCNWRAGEPTLQVAGRERARAASRGDSRRGEGHPPEPAGGERD
jgi:alkyl hydroperoxide reductase subunit AhpC